MSKNISFYFEDFGLIFGAFFFCQKAFVRQQIVTDYSYFVLHY